MTGAVVEVRRATGDDLPAIAALSNRFAEASAATFTIHEEPLETWKLRFAATRSMYPWLVAETAGSFAGFAKAGPYRPRDAYAWTVETSVFVEPAHHGRGVGRALYDRLLALLHLQGYHTAVGVLTVPNAASERLHERAGFRRRGTLERAGFKLGRWHATATYEMQLQDDFQQPGAIQSVDAVDPLETPGT